MPSTSKPSTGQRWYVATGFYRENGLNGGEFTAAEWHLNGEHTAAFPAVHQRRHMHQQLLEEGGMENWPQADVWHWSQYAAKDCYGARGDTPEGPLYAVVRIFKPAEAYLVRLLGLLEDHPALT